MCPLQRLHPLIQMNAMTLFDIRSTHYSVGLGSSRQDFMEIRRCGTSFITYVEVLYTYKFQYSTCRKLMFSVFVPNIHAHSEFYEAFLSTECCTKSEAHDMVIKYEIQKYYIK